MKARTLLERLAEAGTGDQPVPDSTMLRRSILANLRRILNVRPGSVPACPRLGVPPPHELASRWPVEQDAILGQIRQAIQDDEPRLTAIAASETPGGDPAILRLRITAVINDGSRSPFICDTTFDPAGRADPGA